jgi:CheY-like chemotaxis protein
VAHDGASGVALAREMHAEIVFCDLGLPGMDGYQVARALRADAEIAGAHLVALSGLARGKDREQSAAAGFDCHLAKPPSEQDIERILAARRD